MSGMTLRSEQLAFRPSGLATQTWPNIAGANPKGKHGETRGESSAVTVWRASPESTEQEAMPRERNQINRIEARCIRGSEADSLIGLSDVRCPVCDKRICQKYIRPYYEDDTDRSIELCESCVDDFERESDVRIESDVLDGAVFARLWKWTSENLSRNQKRWMRETARTDL